MTKIKQFLLYIYTSISLCPRGVSLFWLFCSGRAVRQQRLWNGLSVWFVVVVDCALSLARPIIFLFFCKNLFWIVYVVYYLACMHSGESKMQTANVLHNKSESKKKIILTHTSSGRWWWWSLLLPFLWVEVNTYRSATAISRVRTNIANASEPCAFHRDVFIIYKIYWAGWP